MTLRTSRLYSAVVVVHTIMTRDTELDAVARHIERHRKLGCALIPTSFDPIVCRFHFLLLASPSASSHGSCIPIMPRILPAGPGKPA